MENADEKPPPVTSSGTNAAAAALAMQKIVQQHAATIANQVQQQQHQQQQTVSSSAVAAPSVGTASLPQYHVSAPHQNMPGSKYQQLLLFIDELGRVIRPTYNANRNAQERLKRDIVQARLLVRECMAELEQQRKQQQQQQQS
ncbi:hypothetical protein niasHT_026658 [Heterodera trifolii]|uniref:Uncharacterized protein n=1 Tax=Heterodera trifolii TaxID=157864 RepID=A0ABD2J0K4_9BILA